MKLLLAVLGIALGVGWYVHHQHPQAIIVADHQIAGNPAPQVAEIPEVVRMEVSPFGRRIRAGEASAPPNKLCAAVSHDHANLAAHMRGRTGRHLGGYPMEL